MQLRTDLESNWKIIKELDAYLEGNPRDAEKWIELADLCKKMNFIEKSKTSYQTAAEIYQSLGNNERYTQILQKVKDLGSDD